MMLPAPNAVFPTWWIYALHAGRGVLDIHTHTRTSVEIYALAPNRWSLADAGAVAVDWCAQ